MKLLKATADVFSYSNGPRILSLRLTNLRNFQTYTLFTFDIIALLSGRSKLSAFVSKNFKVHSVRGRGSFRVQSHEYLFSVDLQTGGVTVQSVQESS